MPRVPVHTPDDAPEEARETLTALGERVGKVINIFGAMAHAPALLEMYASTENLLREKSSLDERARQAIHLTVAAVNECGYCQAAYTGAARQAGFDVEQTKDIRRGELPDDEKLTALLGVAREIAALLDRADLSAEKLGDLLGGLLTLNGDERPRAQEFVTLDLAEVVANVRSNLPPHDLELALDASTVTADRFGLERILATLLRNVLRHAPGSPVRIESAAVAGGVELRVADRGPGVPDDLKQAVYEPFRQGELHDPHSPGTGIGLALVARYVANHGGCTWVSDRPGGGAVFHVRLPDDPSPHDPAGPQRDVCTHDHGAAAVGLVS